MTGCWEHTSVISEALKDARSKRRSLSIILFDLVNAYGAAPHVLILFAMRRYNILDDWKTLVMDFVGEHQQLELPLIGTNMKKRCLNDIQYQ